MQIVWKFFGLQACCCTFSNLPFGSPQGTRMTPCWQDESQALCKQHALQQALGAVTVQQGSWYLFQV